jgi:SAM-dependent methyltransferase
MSNFLANWWRSQQFKSALQKCDPRRAVQLLQEIQKSGARLSWLERLFRDKLQSDESCSELKREASAARRQLTEVGQNLEAELAKQKLQFEQYLERQHQAIKLLQKQLDDQQLILTPNVNFIELIITEFNLIQKEPNLLECTKIDRRIFDELEANLVHYLEDEFKQYPYQDRLFIDLRDTYKQDIGALKRGQDPRYNSCLSPHVYFMVYFLEGIYSGYIAWYLVYKSELLRAKVNVLDIGAGSGAMLYGLFLLLKRANDFTQLNQIHISYCSLDFQESLQYHGLEFWKRYIEHQATEVVNTYWRLKTMDVFTYGIRASESSKLPNNFFDFIVISHCIFADSKRRCQSHQIYKKIFSESLKEDGYVLVIVQGERLFQAYERRMTEFQDEGNSLIKRFVDELGLKLVWYQYLTSTGQRTKLSDFGRFAQENNLPIRKYMSEMAKKYNICGHKYYTLDDYVILARK